MTAIIQELADCLRRYQSRYHKAPHAQKDWERADAALKAWEEWNKNQESSSLTKETESHI